VLPFREDGYFPPESPAASAYRLQLQRGRRLVVDVMFESAPPGRLFVDLFELREGSDPRLVASLAPGAASLTHEVARDAAHVLRVQPELLRGGRYVVVQRTLSSLAFPVTGLTARAVQSAFGAARDAGAREHEGIDIFAARGTAVVAVADGAAQTSTNNLGGNVVWLQDRRRGLVFYYAHLDRWAIERSATVRAGDTLGYIGNTGNARTTAPHLHFGIYERGAIDPLPFVQPDDAVPSGPTASLERLGTLVRTTAARTPLRDNIEAGATARAELPRATLARVVGAARSSLRVVLPDRTSGYVAANALRSADEPLRRQLLPAGAVLRDQPVPEAGTVDVLASALTVDVLGQFGEYAFVRAPAGQRGWVDAGGVP
jgi:murein DD-endopeptidase MepM/ murein hydrolase activator NlpD